MTILSLKRFRSMQRREPQQHIVIAGIFTKGGKVLAVRARNMLNPVTNTEYYDVPAWVLPFGAHPESYLRQRFSEVFNITITAQTPLAVTAHLQQGGFDQHVMVAYQVEGTCATPACEDVVRFLSTEDIDAYVLSEHVKELLRKGLA